MTTDKPTSNIVSLVPNDKSAEDDDGELKIPTVEEVFERIKEAGLKEVVVVGVDDDGNVGFTTNIPSTAEVYMLMDVTKNRLIT